MPRVVLGDEVAQARIPLALVTVQAFASEGAGAVQLSAERAGAPIPPPPVPPPPGVLMISPSDLDGTVIAAAPSAHAAFPAGARVTVILEAGQHSVELAAVDVAGVPRRDVVAIAVEGEFLIIRALREAGSVAAPLSALGEAVRVAVIEVVGGQRVAPADAVSAGIILDGSVSFRRVASSTALARALEVLTGVLAVTAEGLVTVAVSGVAPSRTSVAEVVDITDQALAALGAAPLSLGARLDDPALYVDMRYAYVVTDAEPPGPLPSDSAHIVVVGDPHLVPDVWGPLPVTALDERILDGESDAAAADIPIRGVARSLLRRPQGREATHDERMVR